MFYNGTEIRYKEANQSVVYRYTPSMPDGDSDKKRESIYTNMEAYFADVGYFNMLPETANKENITSVEILSNGDYKVTLVYNRSEELEYTTQPVSLIYEIVVTKEAKYVSATTSIVQVQKWAGNEHNDGKCYAFVYLNMKMDFKYGAVDVEEILTKLAEAKLYDPSQY